MPGLRRYAAALIKQVLSYSMRPAAGPTTTVSVIACWEVGGIALRKGTALLSAAAGV